VNTPIASPAPSGTVHSVTSFLRLVEDLLREPTERAAYLADPAGYLPARGFEDFDTADVEMSLQLTADALPPALAARLDPSEGLDTIVSVDIDELPGLWAQADGVDLTLDDMAHTDDPFLDDDDIDADVVDAASPDVGDGAEAFSLEGAEGLTDEAVVPDGAALPDTEGLTSAPEADSFDADLGFVDAFDPGTAPETDDLELDEPGSFDDDVPFD